MRMWLMLALVSGLVAVGLVGAPTVAAQGSGLPAEALDREWSLTSLQRAPGDVTDTAGAGITLQFGSDGRLSGRDGCNSFAGTYTADEGGQLEITLGPSTLIACEPAVMDLATAYVGALDEVATYRLDGGRLELGFGDQGLLVFEAAGATDAGDADEADTGATDTGATDTGSAAPPATLPSTGGEENLALAGALLALALLAGGAALRRAVRP